LPRKWMLRRAPIRVRPPDDDVVHALGIPTPQQQRARTIANIVVIAVIPAMGILIASRLRALNYIALLQ
jgi:hypothetical protein